MEEKRRLLEKIDEEILALCDVKDIPAEIDESADGVAQILKVTAKIGRYRSKQIKQSKKPIQAVSDEAITIEDEENASAQVTNNIAQNCSKNNVPNGPTLVNTSTVQNVNNGISSTVGGILRWPTTATQIYILN